MDDLVGFNVFKCLPGLYSWQLPLLQMIAVDGYLATHETNSETGNKLDKAGFVVSLRASHENSLRICVGSAVWKCLEAYPILLM